MSTWYISPTGSDTTGNGSYANPYATISKVHTVSSAGDTVIYKNGTYTILAGQTFTKGLTIQAETAGSVILDAANSQRVWIGAITASMSIKDIIFYRWIVTSNSYTFAMGTCTYDNCIFRDSIFNNSSDGLGYTGFIGFNGNLPTIIVQNCLFDDYWTQTYAGQVFSVRQDVQSGTLTVNGCTFYFNTMSVANSALFAAYDASNTTVMTATNCIVYDSNAKWKLYKNNVVATMSYSCAYNWQTPPTGTGIITSDPLFLDAASSNFNLQPDSPCGWGTGVLT